MRRPLVTALIGLMACHSSPPAMGRGGGGAGGEGGADAGGSGGSCDGCEDVVVHPLELCGPDFADCESIVPDPNLAGDASGPITIASCNRGCWEGAPSILAELPESGDLLLYSPANGIQFRTPSKSKAIRTLNWHGPDSWRGGWVLSEDAVTYLTPEGTSGCSATLPGAIDLALDPARRLWVLTDRGTLFAFGPIPWSGSAADACSPVDLDPRDPDSVELRLPLSARGMSLGMNGVLWTSSQPAVRLDVDTLEMQQVPHRNEGPVAVTWDGTAWFGGDELHRIAADGPYDDEAAYETTFGPPGGDVRAAVGDVWSWDGTSLRFAGNDENQKLEVVKVAVPDGFGQATSFGVSWEEAWLSAGDQLATLDRPPYAERATISQPVPGSAILADTYEFDLGNSYYRGRWQHVVDAGEGRTWVSLAWSPTGGRVDMRVRTAARADELPAQTWCGPLHSPADLPACGPPARFAEVMLRLYPGSAPYIRPTVSGIHLIRSPPP